MNKRIIAVVAGAVFMVVSGVASAAPNDSAQRQADPLDRLFGETPKPTGLKSLSSDESCLKWGVESVRGKHSNAYIAAMNESSIRIEKKQITKAQCNKAFYAGVAKQRNANTKK